MNSEAYDQDTRAAIYFEGEKRRTEEMDARHAAHPPGDDKTAALAPYTDGLPYDRDRVMTEIKFFMVQTVQGFIEMGKRLVVLKEMEGHGRFYACLDEMGIHPRSACNYMAVAKKLANRKRISDLKIIDLKEGVGKLYALLDIPEEELAEFDETGELRGLTMDEIDALSVRELKARLRQRNQQIEQGTLQLQEANRRVDALEEEIRDLKSPKRSEAEERFLSRMQFLQKAFDGYLLQLDWERMKELQYDADPRPTDRMRAAYISTVSYMKMQILSAHDAAISRCGDCIMTPEDVAPPGSQPGASSAENLPLSF